MHDRIAQDRAPAETSPDAGDRSGRPIPKPEGFDIRSRPALAGRLVVAMVTLLLAAHAALVGYSATLHSPTLNEPGHLVAGLAQWTFGRFEVYRVNPPLVHYAAALPVMLAGYRPAWDGFYEAPGARPETTMGNAFLDANGPRSAWLFTVARWGCLPFTLAGGLIGFFWSRELWGSSLAGLISLALWCFEPFLLAHAELITNDCAATSLGLASSYFFWRWLRRPSWWRALVAGTALGLAQLSKTTWIVLFGLWPVLWLFWVGTRRGPTGSPGRRDSTGPFAAQLVALLILGVYVLNLGYLFDGTLTRLGDYTFTSRALAGPLKTGDAGNRFEGMWLKNVPVPLPRQYLLGIDLQKRDFETFNDPSFLLGEWKMGGWWYYYLYGLSAKTSLGLQSLVVLGIVSVFIGGRRRPRACPAVGEAAGQAGSSSVRRRAGFWSGDVGFRDLAILAAPGVTILFLVSSQMQFNHHVRYALPVLGFAMVFAGSVAWSFEPDVSTGR